MSDHDNTNRGVLFREESKKSANHPDYKGSINIEGVDYWISGWIKPYQNGEKRLLSLSVNPKEQQQRKPSPQRQASKPSRGRPDPDFDDDPIPF